MSLLGFPLVDERQHGTAHRLRPADLGIVGQLPNGGCDQLDGGFRVSLPVRDQQRPRLWVDEKARAKPQRVSALVAAPACRVAGR
jgi:hypothetical protein